MPRRTLKSAGNRIRRHRDQPPRDDAHTGAQKAFQKAGHQQQQQPHSQSPSSRGEAQEAESDAHVSSQKGRLARNGLHPPPRPERARSNELPKTSQFVSHKPLPPSPKKEGLLATTSYQGNMESNEN